MRAEEWMSDLERRLADAGYDVSRRDIDGEQHLVGYRREFRIAWMFTSIHTYVIARHFPAIDGAQFDAYAKTTMDWAIKDRGLPRGFQTGVAALSVAVTTAAESSARQQAAQEPGKRWGAFPVPMLAEIDQRAITTYDGRPVWGAMYLPYVAEQQRLVSEGLDGKTLDTWAGTTLGFVLDNPVKLVALASLVGGVLLSLAVLAFVL